ncbi:amidohydrolase family protein [Paenibacillus eucommiae]|uniref:TIM-barrel fold metal-dependent hydrolase n=1 Tax=Paenibacillus eucommiae TaxID=1355755 RepID=A0ABS4ILZ7_9BACL|nr:amidohydrolase family protein [Paenibacillus eucommiae]MBP1988564.1 putative TIM-barrel fold metal-dependent hydrolase [Paenibacillus eucommiae]
MSSHYDSLRLIIESLPVIDSHDHIIHPDIMTHGRNQDMSIPISLLIETITGPENRIALLSSGMPASLLNDIVSGRMETIASRKSLLHYMHNIENTVSYNWMARGMEELYGFDVRKLNENNWDSLENRMQKAYENRYEWMVEVFDRLQIRTSLLNMGTDAGAYYYGGYLQQLSQADLASDQRCFTRIATFDSYAMDPFAAVTEKYAQLVNVSYNSLEEYEIFLEKLADFFVTKYSVKGFKFSEAYFRRLDYDEIDKETARKAFKKERTEEEKKQLSNYISYRILELAEKHQIPVQFHTGMRWGELSLQDLNPIYMEGTLKRFPNVNFEFMHGGYPHLGEMSVIAANTPNVFINMSYLTIISYEAAAQWLSVCLDMVPSNKITFGCDVFHLETLYGGTMYVKDLIAKVLIQKIENRLLTEEQAVSIAGKLLHDNANRLFSLGFTCLN